MDFLSQRGVRHYFMDINSIRPTDITTAEGATAQEVEVFLREKQRALSELWMLLDDQIQIQVREYKTSPVALFSALNNSFAATSASLELSKASTILLNPNSIPIASVRAHLAQFFGALATYRRHGQPYPVSAVLTMLRRSLPSELYRALEKLNPLDLTLNDSEISRQLIIKLNELEADASFNQLRSQQSNMFAMAATTPASSATSATFCRNCHLYHPGRCPHPHRGDNSPFEFWKSNNIQPNPEKRDAYNRWIARGAPPSFRSRNNNNPPDRGALDTLVTLLQTLINR